VCERERERERENGAQPKEIVLERVERGKCGMQKKAVGDLKVRRERERMSVFQRVLEGTTFISESQVSC
jgi:hypothetical protein